MTKFEGRIKPEIRMTEIRNGAAAWAPARFQHSNLQPSDLIRHSNFVIRVSIHSPLYFAHRNRSASRSLSKQRTRVAPDRFSLGEFRVADNKAAGRAFLIVSIILGVLATVLAFAYLNQSGVSDNGPKATIMIASHDLAAGTALDPERDLKSTDVAVTLVGNSITPDLAASLKGQRINRFISANQPIVRADVAALAELPITPGYRAISIGVRGPNALPGILAPGDFVKLMVTRPAGRIGAGSTAAGQIWQSSEIVNTPLKVLAVGRRSQRAITAAEQYENTNGGDNSSITLEVTEEQAKEILESTGAGSLTVTLMLVPEGRGAAVATTQHS
jgi:Flp pilus assembly protein CpaB